MLFIDNQGIHDPSINLAIEEYALKHLSMDESYLLFISTSLPLLSESIRIRSKRSTRNTFVTTTFRLCAGCPGAEPYTMISAT